MFQLLRLKDIDNCNLAAKIAERKITSVQNELGHRITVETAANALVQGFKAILKTHLKPAHLTLYEQSLAEKLYASKYATDSWNQNVKA